MRFCSKRPQIEKNLPAFFIMIQLPIWENVEGGAICPPPLRSRVKDRQEIGSFLVEHQSTLHRCSELNVASLETATFNTISTWVIYCFVHKIGSLHQC